MPFDASWALADLLARIEKFQGCQAIRISDIRAELEEVSADLLKEQTPEEVNRMERIRLVIVGELPKGSLEWEVDSASTIQDETESGKPIVQRALRINTLTSQADIQDAELKLGVCNHSLDYEFVIAHGLELAME
jgi:hypothetical protein